ncbi:MAG: hypothetical protein L0229_02405 [Blastocatellia bacterium]|nr:hypothetical protein [Blastocatellia bacterium]
MSVSEKHLDQHDHNHAQNRFAVIPTSLRMDADEALTGKGVTIAFLDSGFYPHADLTQPVNRIAAFVDITRTGETLDKDFFLAARAPEGWAWHGTQTSVVAAGNGRLSDGVYRGLAEASLRRCPKPSLRCS